MSEVHKRAIEIAGGPSPHRGRMRISHTSKAIEMIRRLEGMSRARVQRVRWDGSMRHGNGEWGIALRCAELDGGSTRLFAGGGIVAGSAPEDELDETRIKLLAMQSALG